MISKRFDVSRLQLSALLQINQSNAEPAPAAGTFTLNISPRVSRGIIDWDATAAANAYVLRLDFPAWSGGFIILWPTCMPPQVCVRHMGQGINPFWMGYPIIGATTVFMDDIPGLNLQSFLTPTLASIPPVIIPVPSIPGRTSYNITMFGEPYHLLVELWNERKLNFSWAGYTPAIGNLIQPGIFHYAANITGAATYVLCNAALQNPAATNGMTGAMIFSRDWGSDFSGVHLAADAPSFSPSRERDPSFTALELYGGVQLSPFSVGPYVYEVTP